MHKNLNSKLCAILCATLLIALFASIFVLNVLAILLSILGLSYFYKTNTVAIEKNLKLNWKVALKYTAIPLILWLYTGFYELIITQDIYWAIKQLNNFRPLLYCLLWLPIFYLARSYILKLSLVYVGIIFVFSLIGLSVFLYTGKPFNQAFFYHTPYLMGQIFIIGIFIAWQLAIKYPKYRKVLFMVGAIAVVFLFLANTRRTGQIIFMLCLPLFIWLNLNGKWRVYTLGIATFGLVALSFLPITQNRIHEVYNEINMYRHGEFNSSNGERLRFIKITTNIIEHSPIIGVGVKNYLNKFYQIENNYDGKHVKEKFSHPHNETLYMWACFGIIGLILYLILWIYLLKLALSLPKIQKNLALIAIMACFISILFNAMIIDILEGHFFAMLATSIILAKILNQSKQQGKT